MPLFTRTRPRLTIEQTLAARPLRLVDAEPRDAADGTCRLTLPLKPARWASWLLRVPQGATKTFELDALGLFVWQQCDGKTRVDQLIRRLSERFELNVREAQVATVAFLNMLVRKGLVAMNVPRPQERVSRRKKARR
jgi:hypothetical protein